MNQLFITKFDYDRLMKLLDKKMPHDNFDKFLLGELEKGEIVDPKDIPPDVITMNSQIRFIDDHGDNWEYWLVFPDDADLPNKKISVLSPIGSALIGYRKGDTITIPTPNGHRKLTVKKNNPPTRT